MPRPTCLRLLMHCVRAADSRTFWTAGTNSAIRMAMMAITTSSSMRVNARRRMLRMIGPFLFSGQAEWRKFVGSGLDFNTQAGGVGFGVNVRHAVARFSIVFLGDILVVDIGDPGD